MVVADEDPPRKRSRLSLKSSKKGDNTQPTEDSESQPLESAGTVPQGPTVKSEQEVNDCSPPIIDLTESDLPSDGPGVPPVASMENLGNTCFLNSVLEVLRYTPCFLEGLEELYRHIVYLEKVKTTDVVQDSDEVKTDPSLAWDLVKNMFKMYKKMEKREEMFCQFANADVTSMAVKPDKVLDVIREFNPMFEGNMQHDAQEVLRCVLCYLEDSERELHSDYASILALDPSLLKTPTLPPAPSTQDTDRQVTNPVMDRFLAAGKAKLRRGKSAVTRLKFDQPSSESHSPDSGDPDFSRQDHDGVIFKRSSPIPIKTDILDASVGGSKEDQYSDSAPQAKKRKLRHTKLRRMVEEEGDEVDSEDRGDKPVVSPHRVPSPHHEAAQDKDDDQQVPELCSQQRRRSVRQKVANRRLNQCMSRRMCHPRPKVSEDSEQDVGFDCVITSIQPGEKVMVNGDHADPLVDRNQPTILSMFGKKGGQCRRLGMRGRVIQTTPNTDLSPPQQSPQSPHFTLEPRRSPRKTNTVRPVAVTASPRKHNGIMTPSASPARPDEFPAHAVSRSGGVDFDPTLSEGKDMECQHTVTDSDNAFSHRSPAPAHVTLTSQSQSPKSDVNVGSGVTDAATLTRVEVNDSDSKDGDEAFKDELPDLVPVSECDSGHEDRTRNAPCSLKSRLEKMLASSTKTSRLPSPARPSTMSPSLRKSEERRGKGKPSKLMIKLEKCDHLCNSPTISASAALEALKGPSSTCRKMTFTDPEADDDNSNDQDSDEDEELSLGTKSSFKSVPLKSVCVKVEKCDMVCDSPEKSVSARFATSCLARQRVQRFNMIEKLFQGTMMMRTKCLECERCTERKECFQDVSVPLSAEGSASSDSESEEERDSSLLRLMRAFTDVEHLRDDNKYYCEQCYRYVEAERSLHYEALPNILTVHLKRFSAAGMFGCLSKINDHVTVPLLLSCLRYKCPKPCVRPDHRYTLYAIVTHAGSTISSGHYLSYIKVRPNAVGHDTLSTYLNHNPPNTHTHTHHADTLFHRQSPSSLPPASSLGMGDSPPSPTEQESAQRKTQTHTMSDQGDCNASSSLQSDQRQSSDVSTVPRALSPDGDGQEKTTMDSDTADYHWLECDDETIRILSEKEFHGRLLEKEGALRGTPYVLFYHRLDTWKAKQ